MMTSLEEIRGWYEAAKKNGSTHMIVVCDTFDHEDYPLGVYERINGNEHCLREYDAHQGVNMQRVMEVYDIGLGWNAQSGGRVMNLPPRQAAPVPVKWQGNHLFHALLCAQAAHGPVALPKPRHRTIVLGLGLTFEG
jgi:hypothetical protein